MSNPGTPLPLPTTGNPGLDSLLRSAAIAVTTSLSTWVFVWLSDHGYKDPNINALISGAIGLMVAGVLTAVWGWLKGTQIGQFIEHRETVAVQAGINLAVAGAAIAGTTPNGTLVPKPVTTQSAKEIIANYGTMTETEKTAALNNSQLHTGA